MRVPPLRPMWFLAAVAALAGSLLVASEPGRAESPATAECPELGRLPAGVRAQFVRDSATLEIACRTAKFFLLKAKPADQLLAPAAFAEYREALETEDCDAAQVYLINAFDAAYPHMPSIIDEPANFKLWKERVAWLAYPEVIFCGARRDVRVGQRGLERLGLVAGRVRSLFEPGYLPPRPLTLRNSGIVRIAVLLSAGHAPAYAELARLSAEGKIIRFVPEDQYYLARRAQHLGAKGDEIDQLTAAAAARLTPEQIAAIEPHIARRFIRALRPLRVE